MLFFGVSAALAVFTVLIAFLSKRVIKKGALRWVLVGAIFVAMVLRIAVMFYMYLPGAEMAGTDGREYHLAARAIQEQLKQGTPLFSIQYDSSWYSAFLGFIYYLTGTGRYGGSMVNIFLVAVTGLILARLLLRVGVHKRLAVPLTIVYLLLPDMICWTADTRKEALLSFCVIAALYFLLRIRQESKGRLLNLAFLCFFILLCSIVRIYAGYPLVIAAVYMWMRDFKKRGSKVSVICIVIMLVFCVVMTVLAVYPALFDYHAVPMSWFDKGDGSLENEFESLRQVFLTRNLGVAALSFFLLPLPTNINMPYIQGTPIAVFSIQVEMIVYYVLLVLFLVGSVFAVRRRDPFLIALLLFIVFYSVPNILFSEFVSDTILRYRSVIIGPMLPVVAEYWRARRESAIRRQRLGSRGETHG